MDRRDALKQIVLFGIAALPAGRRAFAQKPDPWPTDALLSPSTLRDLISGGDAPTIYCVGFPTLFHEKHLPGSIFTGPASKPAGVKELVTRTKGNSGSQIVIYCGCCPMTECPNIRPAWEALASHKVRAVQVLNLPHNFHTDWVAKGYPVESA